MNRRLLNLLTALSLLLCMAVVAMWVRGFWASDRFYVTPNVYLFSVVGGSGGGWVELSLVMPDQRRPYRRAVYQHWVLAPGAWPAYPGDRVTASPSRVRLPGFAWYASRFGPDETIRGLYVAWPLAAAVTLTLPAWRAYARLRGFGRRRRSLCPTCGYDLRATPGRCPECGASASVPTNASNVG